jgi:hypothetical protein
MARALDCLIPIAVLAGCTRADRPAAAPEEPQARTQREAAAARPKPLAQAPDDPTLRSLEDRLGAPLTPAAGSLCPIDLPAVALKAEESDSGAALAFTTTRSEQVERLRARVAALSRLPALAVSQARVRTDNVAGGIRLVFDAPEAGQLTALRDAVRQRADELRRSCPAIGTPAESGSEPGEPTTPAAGSAETTKPAEPDKRDEPDTDDDKKKNEDGDGEAEEKKQDRDKDKSEGEDKQEEEKQKEQKDQEPGDSKGEDEPEELPMPERNRW